MFRPAGQGQLFLGLQCLRIWGCLCRPTLQMSHAQSGHGTDPVSACVQAGYVIEPFATSLNESHLGFLLDFFQGFQAVAGEARAYHIHFPDTRLGHGDQGGLGSGFQPFGFAKTRLEGNTVTLRWQLQCLGQKAGGFHAFAVVGVAQVQGAFGHAMKTHHQTFAFAMGLPVLAHLLGQALDVAGIVVVVVDESQLWQVTALEPPAVELVNTLAVVVPLYCG